MNTDPDYLKYTETTLNGPEKEIITMCKYFVGNDEYKVRKCSLTQVYGSQKTYKLLLELSNKEQESEIIDNIINERFFGGYVFDFVNLHKDILNYLKEKNGD
jgi:hypothetical protein